MTPLEHRQEAERLLKLAGMGTSGEQIRTRLLAEAQVHALLALGGQQT